LANKIELIVKEYNETFFQDKVIIKPICTLRLASEQLALFKIGRVVEMVNGIPVVKSVDNRKIVTKLDGIVKRSKHNPTPTQPLSRACDIGAFCGGKYLTDTKYYEPLLTLARKHNLISGWDFGQTGLTMAELKKKKGFKDAPHLEIKGY
jgi:hypothetical protein